MDFELRGGDVVLVQGSREAKGLGGRFAGSGMLDAHMGDRATECERDRCFALATAAARGLVLWTGDPEILGMPDPPCPLEDLRALPSVG